MAIRLWGRTLAYVLSFELVGLSRATCEKNRLVGPVRLYASTGVLDQEQLADGQPVWWPRA